MCVGGLWGELGGGGKMCRGGRGWGDLLPRLTFLLKVPLTQVKLEGTEGEREGGRGRVCGGWRVFRPH